MDFMDYLSIMENKLKDAYSAGYGKNSIEFLCYEYRYLMQKRIISTAPSAMKTMRFSS